MFHVRLLRIVEKYEVCLKKHNIYDGICGLYEGLPSLYRHVTTRQPCTHVNLVRMKSTALSCDSPGFHQYNIIIILLFHLYNQVWICFFIIIVMPAFVL